MRYRHSDEDLRRRLLARSEVVGGAGHAGVACREWCRSTNGLGYGRLWDGLGVRYVHRLAWEVFRGPVPEGVDVLHRCDNPGCIEVRHLWLGTHAENMADRDAKGRNGGWKNRGRSHVGVRGSEHPLSKLTEGQAVEIRRRVERDRPTALAREFGVSEGLVRSIRDGRAWGWLAP